MGNDVFLVTGATGFTGGWVTDLLVSRGSRVRVLVRDERRAAEFTDRGIEVVIGDLNSQPALSEAVRGVTVVLHIAALFRQAGLPASEFRRVNVEGTRNLLEAAIAAGVDRMIHCSTVGVLGHIEKPPANEETGYNPGDPYQQSKMEGELLFLDYVRSGRIKGCVIRPAMIYGPGDTRTLKLFKPISRNRFFYVGRGDSLVHFVDVRDLARSFLTAAERDDVNGDVFIIAGETSLPLKDIAEIIADIMGVSPPWIHLPTKPLQILGSLCEAACTPFRINAPLHRRRVDFFTKDRSFDTSRARTKLGFTPAKPLVQELVEIIDWYEANGMISTPRTRRPSAIVRGLDGRILGWSRGARELYGWSGEEAVGRVTHSLLATKFPSTLASISDEVQHHGKWRGRLTHRRRDGKALSVTSTWKVLTLQKESDPIVLELNTPASGGPDGSGVASIGSAVLGTLATDWVGLLACSRVRPEAV